MQALCMTCAEAAAACLLHSAAISLQPLQAQLFCHSCAGVSCCTLRSLG
jgi:hypothetical protein